MKTTGIILISISAVILISIVVRETGLLDIDGYKSNNQLLTTDNWTEIDTSEPKNRALKKVDKNDLSILILSGKDTLYKKINKLKPIVVTMDTLDAGPLWFPLYKSTKYTATASTSLLEDGSEDPSHHGIIRQLKGQLNLNGELTIMGMCSNRNAKKILYQSIVEGIAEKVRDRFSTLPEDFFLGPMKNSLAYEK